MEVDNHVDFAWILRGYVEVYPTLLIRTVRRLCARKGRRGLCLRVRVASQRKMDMERSWWLVSSSVRTRCCISWLRPWIMTLNPWTSNSGATFILSSIVFNVDYYNRTHPIPSLAPVTRPWLFAAGQACCIAGLPRSDTTWWRMVHGH